MKHKLKKLWKKNKQYLSPFGRHKKLILPENQLMSIISIFRLICMKSQKFIHSLKKCSFFRSDSGPVPKSVKNVTFSSTNHDLFLNKKHFWFQKKNIITGHQFVLFSCFCFKSVSKCFLNTSFFAWNFSTEILRKTSKTVLKTIDSKSKKPYLL
jgi:hypothetical protein